MLVLTRKLDQRIKIGDHVEITIVRLGKDNVRIGVDAPADWPIFRSELVEVCEGTEQRAQGTDDARGSA